MIGNNKFHLGPEEGFTVVELIVTTLVFSIVLAAVAMVFIRATSLQRRAFASEQIQSTTLAMTEQISRDARVSQICPNTGVCSTTVLEMMHGTKGLIRYFYDNVQGKILFTNNSGMTAPITSEEVNYTDFSFNTSWDGSDCRQPKITMSFTAQNREGVPVSVQMQTTVVSRDFSEEVLYKPSPCP